MNKARTGREVGEDISAMYGRMFDLNVSKDRMMGMMPAMLRFMAKRPDRVGPILEVMLPMMQEIGIEPNPDLLVEMMPSVLVVGGGIGLAPLRPLVNYILAHRAEYGDLQLVYGARTPADLIYRAEMQRWRKAENTEVIETIDMPADGWDGRVGFVPAVLKEVNPDPAKVAITCGPPIMIKFVVQTLKDLGFADEMIHTTLEMKMKCGVGKCGRCNIGGKYVCKDGPVFTWAELGKLPPEY